jgi:type IV pilus assembly protein PilV
MLRRLRDGRPCSGFKGRLQRGVALLEVLIAVVILSIGLLGLASLQVNSLRFNHSAYLRSQATILAYDMADRMRANRRVALDGEYNLAMGAAPAAGATVVAIDLLEWRAQLAAQLPGGDGSIDVNAANDMVTITVAWDDTRGAGAATQFTFRSQL